MTRWLELLLVTSFESDIKKQNHSTKVDGTDQRRITSSKILDKASKVHNHHFYFFAAETKIIFRKSKVPINDEFHHWKYSAKLRRFITTIIVSSKLLLMQDGVLQSLQNYGKRAFEATFGQYCGYLNFVCSSSHIINENINFVLRTYY